jgi:hypothetical protein
MFLATFKIRKRLRPKSEPRFGSVQERLGLTLNTNVVDHLLGNTQALKNPRMMSRDTDPRRLAEWTLPAFAERLQFYADKTYASLPHPALHGLSPRRAGWSTRT